VYLKIDILENVKYAEINKEHWLQATSGTFILNNTETARKETEE
jgi:hypothetical protein